MKPGVHQVLGGAGPWDAITNHALAARDVIRKMGYRSEIFADNQHISIAVASEVFGHEQWRAVTDPCDAAILHYSIDSPAFETAIDAARTAGIYYHNVTPPNLLWRDAPGIALQCEAGLVGLASMSRRTQTAAAVSAFNAQEMERAGFRDPAVVGILRSRLPRRQRHRTDNDRVRLVFVGRGIPNKRQDALVAAVAALREDGIDAELRLVGGWGACRPFLERCKRLVRDLDLRDSVVFTGAIDDGALAQEYADADVFVCLSEHEGFCVPLIEAMAADLPIVALRAGAVPETLGHAGLLIDSIEPSTVANAVSVLLEQPPAGAFAAARARQLEFHSFDATAERLRSYVRGLVA